MATEMTSSAVGNTSHKEVFGNDFESSVTIGMERQKLHSIFPEEIWLMILDKAHWSAKEAACIGSSYLREVLYETRQCFLFPKVWKVLGFKYELASNPHPDDYYDAYLIKTSGEFGVNRILSIRQVCRDWCAGVDHFYETRYPLYSMNEGMSQLPIDADLEGDHYELQEIKFFGKLGLWADYTFSYGYNPDRNIRKFLEKFRDTHYAKKNPFIGRSVEFYVEEEEPCNSEITEENRDIQYLANTSDLLASYGSHIWFCAIRLHDLKCSTVELSQKVYDWLALMPNVRVLRIYFKGSNDNLSEVQLQELKGYFESHKKPLLENLQMLSLSVPAILTTELLSRTSQLNTLELLSGDKVNLNDFQLPCLKRFGYVADSMQQFELLQNCHHSWPLEALQLDFMPEVPFLTREHLFGFVKKWQNTLNDVAIYLPQAISDEDKLSEATSYNSRLNLPKVKRFRVVMPKTVIPSIDFVLPMKSLQILEVIMDFDADYYYAIPEPLLTQMKNVDWFTLEDELDYDHIKDCEIWRQLPNLKRIHTLSTIYARWRECYSFIRNEWKRRPNKLICLF